MLAFIALEAVLLNTPAVTDAMMQLAVSRYGWLMVLGGFMAASYVANMWANSATSLPMQYLGLGLYVVAEAVIFLPLLHIASNFGGEAVIPIAGTLTLIVFTGLTAVVMLTGADFSFLRVGLSIAGLAAFGVAVCAVLFGFAGANAMNIPFSAAMVLLASGYILYDTSNVLHHYRIGQHVAASLALFASVALLFYYILRILMALNRR